MSVISAIVLAAGESRRMGTDNKLLLPVGGVPLLRHTVDTLLNCPLQEIVVVLGHESERLQAALNGLAVRCTVNPHYQEGQMTSVHAGLAALSARCDGVMVCLGDQVLLTPADLIRLADAFSDIGERTILVPTYRQQRGNPVVFSYAHRDAILAGGRNLGCRKLIDANPDLVATLEMNTDHVVVDLDTPEDYRAVLARLGGPSHAPGVSLSAN
jgi:molybdenum cofactor cytidylyltransferase